MSAVVEGAIVKAEVVAQADWRQERIDLVKKTVCPTGISDAEFGLFIEVCKRSGLDPLTKEIFCVPRRVNAGSKDSPKWITKHEAQPAEAGILARADRFSDFGGIKAAAYYEGDDITVTEDGVRHSFNPAKRSGKLIGAWAQAYRSGRALPVEIVTFEAYRQNTAQWSSKPETMIVKCARAAALRRAYPNAFGGLYLKEEMPAEEFDVTQEAQQIKPKALPKETARPEQPKAQEATKREPDPIRCAEEGHRWTLKGECSECGAKEKPAAKPATPTQPPPLRARAIKVWQRAQGAKMDLSAFQKWTESVLGRKSESASWTEDEIAHLEVALQEVQGEPGAAG